MVLDASIAYAESADTEGFAGPRTLGDFRIGRELGRGGMGIVYEAEQLSIGRSVALKILPMAAVLDPRQVRRFKNEVQAAALLQHQHIVPIYAVGCERGIHYYAMQYVEGQTLAEVIGSLRETAAWAGDRSQESGDRRQESGGNVALDTTGSVTVPAGVQDRCRAAARLIIQAAEALDHAHQRGVLHRDVKPANLMVDGTGNLWITDFGLAQLEADAGMTTTGQFVGTLRYMSPEQALAKRVVIDQRADIYSLGATLYELCALQPAYVADDRQELLRQIAFETPQRLRKRDPAIPQELDTITFKAIEKDPADRYQTAQEMADDLRRYLDDRPILARPPSRAERVRKWAARNRKTAAVSAVAVLVALLASLAGVAYHSSRVSSANRSLQTLNRALVASRDKTRELLYLADMQLAFGAWDRRHFTDLQRLLDRHKPQPGETDVRGIEWNLLASLAKPPQPFVFLGHDGPVRDIALVPGKEEFVSVGDDGTIRHWSIPERRLLRTIETGLRQLHAAAISPDAKWLATGNPTLELWDFAAGEKVRDLSWQDYTLECIAFSPDSQSIAAAWRHDEVRVVALDGEVRSRLPPVGLRNETLAFSQDGETLFLPYVANEQHVVRQWRVDSPSEWMDFAEEGAAPSWNRLAVSHDDRVSAVVTYTGGTIHVLDNATGQRIGTIGNSADPIRAIDFSPRSDRLAWGSDDGTLYAAVMPHGWQFHSTAALQQAVPRRIAAHDCKITDVEHLSGDRVLTCSEDGTIKMWNMLHSQIAMSLELPGIAIDRIAFTPCGSQVAVPCTDGQIWFGSTRDGREVESVRIGAKSLNEIAFTPDGSRLIAGDNDGGIAAWDRAEHRVVARWNNPTPARILALAIAPSGDHVATAAADQLLRIHDADALSVVNTITAPANVAALDFSPDGRLLAWGGGFSELFLYDADCCGEAHRISTRSACVCIAFANSGLLLASGHENGSIQVIDSSDGTVLQRFASDEGVQSITWSPDDRLLISMHHRGIQRVWHVSAATELGVLHRGGMTYGTTRYSPDGSRLAAVLCEGGEAQGILWKLSD